MLNPLSKRLKQKRDGEQRNGGEKVKNRVREIREEKRMTQAELAEKSGLSRQTIIAIETEENYSTTTGTLLKIANALETPINLIFLQ